MDELILRIPRDRIVPGGVEARTINDIYAEINILGVDYRISNVEYTGFQEPHTSEYITITASRLIPVNSPSH